MAGGVRNQIILVGAAAVGLGIGVFFARREPPAPPVLTDAGPDKVEAPPLIEAPAPPRAIAPREDGTRWVTLPLPHEDAGPMAELEVLPKTEVASIAHGGLRARAMSGRRPAARVRSQVFGTAPNPRCASVTRELGDEVEMQICATRSGIAVAYFTGESDPSPRYFMTSLEIDPTRAPVASAPEPQPPGSSGCGFGVGFLAVPDGAFGCGGSASGTIGSCHGSVPDGAKRAALALANNAFGAQAGVATFVREADGVTTALVAAVVSDVLWQIVAIGKADEPASDWVVLRWAPTATNRSPLPIGDTPRRAWFRDTCAAEPCAAVILDSAKGTSHLSGLAVDRCAYRCIGEPNRPARMGATAAAVTALDAPTVE